MPSGTRSKAAIAGIAGVALALMTAGCSSSKSSAPSATSGGSSAASSSGVDAAAAALLPASVKGKGVISFATDPSYPPNESKNADGKIVGFDVDLGNAIAAKLGLKATFSEVTFDNIIVGVSSGSYDAGMSSITDNKKREAGDDEYVTYFNAGTKLMVPHGNPKNLTDNSQTDLSLCGLTIGVEKGTVQEDPDVPARDAACKAAGKPGIKTLSQDTQDQINTSLQSGRCDAVLADSPVVDYFAKGGQFDAVGPIYSSAPYGIAVAKANDPLAKAMLAALKDLIADGTYHKITQQWGISSGDYSGVGINQATS